MTKVEVEVFSTDTNASVVRLPERQFPGIVIQGDSLKIMLDTARDISRLSKESGVPELVDSVAELEEMLGGYLRAYEISLRKHNVSLPYAE